MTDPVLLALIKKNSSGGGSGGAQIDDSTTATTSTWSSQKINESINEIQEKIENGDFTGPQGPQGDTGPQGAPGLDAPQIDDTQITTTNPWSSMQIVKTLCPPFTVTGASDPIATITALQDRVSALESAQTNM